MSLVEELHAAHKARLARMGGYKPGPKPIVDPIDDSAYWPGMWMWDLIDWQETRSVPKVSEIITATAKYYHLPIGEMLSDLRTAKVVLPRQVAMYLAKELTFESLPAIGRRFGGKDHTTVLHAYRKIAAEKDKLSHIGAAVTSLKRRFGHYG